MKPYSRILSRESTLGAVSKLLSLNSWFRGEPLPDGNVTVSVRPEDAVVLDSCASTQDFLAELEAQAVFLPLKGTESTLGHDFIVRYWNLDPINEAPWVEIVRKEGVITATISGGDRKAHTPKAALKLLREDCRWRLKDAGVDPAF